MSLLEGKAAMVTGAASGIGQATALALAAEGANVAILDLNADGLAETARGIAETGRNCLARRCDVSRRDEVDAAVEAAQSELGTVEILFNSATIIRLKPLEEQTEADLMDTISVHVLGTFNFMQACFPGMKALGRGKIINCASAVGTMGLALHSTYGTAKEAVRGLTKTAAREWGQYGINVNAIMPAAVTPSFWPTIDLLGDRETVTAALREQTPMRRLGDPARDIAPVVVFLASPTSDYITGRSLFVDGGQGAFS